MRTKIAKWGNSLGVRLSKSVLEQAGFEEGQEVEMIARAGSIDIRSPSHSVRLSDLIAEAKRLGPENAPPFEDWGIFPTEWPVEDWSDIAPGGEKPAVSNAQGRRKTAGRR